MVRHADWNKDKHGYDIALVHFVADARRTPKGRPGRSHPLYDGPPLEAGVNVYATGWGQLEGQAKASSRS